MTKIRGSLPKGDANGLGVISRELIENPDKVHVVLMLVKTSRLSTDVESGDVEATAYIRRLEVVIESDHELAFRMLERSLGKRTGMTTLPFELEDDLRAAFAELNIDALIASAGSDEAAIEQESTGDVELDLLLRMVELAVTKQNAAVSFLTRELGIGATKCKQMLSKLESLQIVTPPAGLRPRDVLVYPEQLPAVLLRIRQDDTLPDDGSST